MLRFCPSVNTLNYMQFDTKNLSFRQVMGNGLKYNVPRFQRDYSWREEQWEDLWQDIIESCQTESSHYMGYLVLQSSDNINFIIIDGQQRLTTISIFILAALHELKILVKSDENQKRMDAIQSSFIGFTDPVSLQLKYKLNLNRNNDRHFKTYLCGLLEPPVRNINRSEKLMGEALRYFRKELKSHFDNRLKGQEVARLIESMVQKLIFTTITVGSDVNAYTVFETLNARGVQLSTPDLVKNYIFSLIDRKGDLHDEQIKGLEDKWSNIIGQLGEYKFSHFIRVDWNSHNDFSRKSELFKKIKTNLKDAMSAKKYLDRLQENSQIYSALQSENDEFWTRHKDGLYNEEDLKFSLKMLNWFNIIAPQSVLIAGFHKFNSKDFIKFLYYIETLSVRYNIICGKSPGPQEKIYSETARAIEQSSKISPDIAVSKILKKIYPSDEEFMSAFEVKIFKTQQTAKKARYFLYRIEKYLNKNQFPSFDNSSLEHILPKNPSEKWLKEFESEDKLEDWINRIGNMTLLSHEQNTLAGRKDFEEKRKHLQDSPFEIAKQCLKYNKWDENAISARQKWLAEQAKMIWRFP